MPIEIPLDAIKQVLLANDYLANLIGNRVFYPELPFSESDEMPRKCIRLQQTGPGFGSMGNVGYIPISGIRIDMVCYGETSYEAEQVFWPAHRILTQHKSTKYGELIVHPFIVAGGPVHRREYVTNYPATLGMYVTQVTLPEFQEES